MPGVIRSALLLALVVCSGCASNRMEATWQAVHLVDGLQTLSLAGDTACYQESDPLTKRLIGKYPSKSEAVAWWAGVAVLHAGVTHWLERWPRWQKVWQGVTLANSTYFVAENHRAGLRIDGDNVGGWGPRCPR